MKHAEGGTGFLPQGGAEAGLEDRATWYQCPALDQGIKACRKTLLLILLHQRQDGTNTLHQGFF